MRLLIDLGLAALTLAALGRTLLDACHAWANPPKPTSPLDGFHRSVRRWGYVHMAQGRV